MNDSETALMINKIKSRKHGKDLIKDMTTIKDWYSIFSSSHRGSILYTPLSNALLSNAYKCFTLDISRYITKYSSPLSMEIYEIKHVMEGKILSKEFLNTNKPTYEWLIDTFQYVTDIPVDTPNSTYTQMSDKQVCVRYNPNYTILNKLALLVKNRSIPFTINFNSSIVEYHRYLTPGIDNKFRFTMAQLVFIQILKNKADSNVTYTLFEEALDEKSKELLALKPPVDLMKPKKSLRKTIQAMKDLHSIYLKYLRT